MSVTSGPSKNLYTSLQHFNQLLRIHHNTKIYAGDIFNKFRLKSILALLLFFESPTSIVDSNCLLCYYFKAIFAAYFHCLSLETMKFSLRIHFHVEDECYLNIYFIFLQTNNSSRRKFQTLEMFQFSVGLF